MSMFNVPLGEIKGDERKRTHYLAKLEDKFIDKAYPFVPKFIQTNHLTLVSIIFSSLVVLFGFLSNTDKIWLLGISLVIEFHYITDALDGETGRRRDTGLIRWGFYADHFLDLFFIAAILIAYSFAFPELVFVNFLIFITLSLYFFESVLFALVGEEYKTSGLLGRFSPTELTQMVVILNVAFIFIPNNWIDIAFKFFFVVAFAGLWVHFHVRGKELWKKDMDAKKNR